eukprot:COSAG02_NODE_4030_length_5883_cov_9.896266_4_plen_89_part_00
MMPQRRLIIPLIPRAARARAFRVSEIPRGSERAFHVSKIPRVTTECCTTRSRSSTAQLIAHPPTPVLVLYNEVEISGVSDQDTEYSGH